MGYYDSIYFGKIKKRVIKMIIICASDSHGHLDKLKKIYQIHPNADLYIDVGDSEKTENEILPFQSVKGNNDYFITNKFRKIEIDENIKIYITHGDKILLNRDSLLQVAKNNDCNFIIHGHTHIPHYSFYKGVHILCPGALTYSRSTSGPTYAIIKIENGKIEVEIIKVEK